MVILSVVSCPALTYTALMFCARFLSLWLVTLIFCPLAAVSDDFKHVESSEALERLEAKVRYYTLPNGMRVILYRRGVAPVFAAALVVRVGGVDEDPGSTGLSHMLEHMAFKGTSAIGTKNYAKEKKLLAKIEEYETRLSAGSDLTPDEKKDYQAIMAELKELWILGDFNNLYDVRGANGLNATTDKELTKYFVNLPRNAFEFWCWIESERLLNPVMRQFYQERDVVMEERRMRFDDDPQGRLYENLLGVAYLSHPYRNPVIGYEFDLKRLTATMAAELHKQYYVAPNIVISLVGDVNPDEDIKVIERYFSRIPGTRPPIKNLIPEEPQLGERRVELRRNSAKHIYIGYHKPAYPDPDDAPISIMAEILAGSRVSPLYRELVKNKKIATSIQHDETPGYSYPNLLLFGAQPNNPHGNGDLLKGFDSVIETFLRKGPTKEQLEIAKRSVAMEYLVHLKSNISLAKDFASSASVYNNYLASIDWYNRAMRVSLDDIRRVAAKYLRTANRTIATVESLNQGGES